MSGEVTEISLAEEKLRLEREALKLERERFEMERQHAKEELMLAKRKSHPFLLFLLSVVFSALCFVGGILFGFSIKDSEQESQRNEKLARALSALNHDIDVSSITNSGALPTTIKKKTSQDAHKDVKVLVIQ